jgi:cell division protein YceG involved in septum cleavage
MSHVETRLKNIRYNIATVKENRNNKFLNPQKILIILSMIEAELEINVEFMKTKII